MVTSLGVLMTISQLTSHHNLHRIGRCSKVIDSSAHILSGITVPGIQDLQLAQERVDEDSLPHFQFQIVLDPNNGGLRVSRVVALEVNGSPPHHDNLRRTAHNNRSSCRVKKNKNNEVTYRQTDYCNPSCHPHAPRVNKLTQNMTNNVQCLGEHEM